MRLEYPFSAVVGEEELKLALVLVAIDPTIGGVLIKGERGTAKSTIARGLAALMPERDTGTLAPFVELPLGATEDRVVGSLDVTTALREGRTQLRSGLLARADGGILYVDEVNLLPDHLVDLLLDAAARGWVTVERDGLSAGEGARFVLIGTMNPEEGELRPQFLDRFGLSVRVRGLASPELRSEALSRRLKFDADPMRFVAEARCEDLRLRQAIVDSRARLPELQVTGGHLSAVAAICVEHGLDGIRGDLAIIKAARALAAWEGAHSIEEEHIRRAADFAVPHRLRRRPDARAGLALSGTPAHTLAGSVSSGAPTRAPMGLALSSAPTRAPVGLALSGAPTRAPVGLALSGTPARERAELALNAPAHTLAGSVPSSAPTHAPAVSAFAPAVPSRVPTPPHHNAVEIATDAVDPDSSGRRGSGSTASRRAPRAEPYDQKGTLALNETLTAAASRGVRVGDTGLAVSSDDLMQHRRSGPGGVGVLFLVDGSGSMAAQHRLEVAKGAALAMLQSSYQLRDEVALMVFRGTGTDLVLPFTKDVERIESALRHVPTGGRTPLARALLDAAELLQARSDTVLVLFTDGRANVSLSESDATQDPWDQALAAARTLVALCSRALVVDCETGPVTLGRARLLAESLQGECTSLGELEASDMTIRLASRLRKRGGP